MKFVPGKYAALTAITLLAAGGVGAYFANSSTKPIGWRPDILSIMHSRSPGERAEGALLVKKGMATLAESTPAPVAAKVPAAIAVPAAPSPLAPIATAATPVPAVIPAVMPAVSPIAAIPAAAHAAGLIFPPVFIPGGHHTTTHVVTVVTPPPTTPSPPPPVPGVPEPQTWVMMMVGFGLLGVFLRRRKSAIARQPVQVRDATLQRS